MGDREILHVFDEIIDSNIDQDRNIHWGYNGVIICIHSLVVIANYQWL
jgi:hypothetical protein